MMEISIVKPSSSFPLKWDVADPLPQGITLHEFLDNAEPYVYQPPAPEDKGYLTQDEAIELMNSKYAIVLYSGKMVIFGMGKKDASGRKKITYSSPSDIKQFYVEKVLVGYTNQDLPKFRSLGEYWITHPKAKRFEQVIFLPNAKKRDGIFNLWQGFACEPKAGSWSLFKDHLFNNICGGNVEYYNYLIAWIAGMLQKPDSPGEVAIVLKGGRGVGKGKVASIIGKILGQHFLHISNAKHLVGNFNAHLIDCIFLFVDEAFWAGDKQGESTLKVLVTEKMNLIESKGKDALLFPNYLHIFMASNQSWVVPAGMDERRYFVLNVSDKRKQDKSYFAAIDKEMLENGGCEAFLHDMLKMDLSSFEVRDAPKTDALLEQKIQSLLPHQTWWFQILQDGLLLPTDSQWRVEVTKSDLQEYYAQTLNLAGQRHRAYSTQLGVYLKELAPNMRSVPKPPRYIFPPLEVCRKHFEKMIGAEIGWTEPDSETEEIKNDELPF